jgi:hypothetical protein
MKLFVEYALSNPLPALTRTGCFVGDSLLHAQQSNCPFSLVSSFEAQQLHVVLDFPWPSVLEFVEGEPSSESQFMADGVQIRNEATRSIAWQCGFFRQLQ